MGAWGYRTFEDDTACDWLDDLVDGGGLEQLVKTLSPEDRDGGAADYTKGVEILAASEIVYGLLNGPREGVPDKAVEWIAANKNADVSVLKPMCEGQLGRVLLADSELRQLWEENADEFELWKESVESLLNGLKD